MNAKELRIGNYVLKENGSIGKIGISSFRIAKVLKPIPITEQWLLDFGFEKTKYGFKITRIYLQENELTKGDWFVSNWQSFEQETIAIISHIHQLQNLYFALTGQELNNN